MIWVGFIIVLCYFFAIVLLRVGYDRVSYFSVADNAPKTKFSLVIPFRNEAENLSVLVQSLQQIKYPKSYFELIFVNDASTDISEEVISEKLKKSTLNFQILQNIPNQPSPKKTAITLAIEAAQHPWILTTDADCSVHENWLRVLNDFIIHKNPVCVAMPVDYKVNNSFLQHYQLLDNWSLQAVTAGSFGLGNIVLSNGANFAYGKEAFKKVNGFSGNEHIASGDDMFLLEKFKKATPKQIGYLKSRNAVVITKPVNSWKQLIAQRVRWASKTTKQQSVVSKVLGLVVFAFNLLLLTSLVLTLVYPQQFYVVVALFFFKLCTDFSLLWKSAQFFRKKFPFLSFLSFLGSTFVYPMITVLVVISSFSGSYFWKGRRFKKM